METLETREIEFRIDNAEERTVVGMAVPYETEAHGERFERGAVNLHQDAKLYWNHKEVIGVIERGQHTEDGYMIEARFAKGTQAADEAYALATQGIVNKFSVGFIMDEARQDGATRVVTRATVKEVSLTPMPWYETADVLGVRNEEELTEPEIPASAPNKEETVEETTPAASDLAEVREAIQGLERELVDLKTKDVAPAADNRSVGEFVLALAQGEERALAEYEGRSFATTADSVVTPIDRDLAQIVRESAPLLSVFSNATTPATGMNVTYAKLVATTDNTGEQAAEGDTLGYTAIEVGTDQTAIKTIGNYSGLSKQVILRSEIDFAGKTFEFQAAALGKALNDEVVSAYQTVHAAQVTAGNTVTLSANTWAGWVSAIADAQALYFEPLGKPITHLVVDLDTAKDLFALESAGNLIIQVAGAGALQVGSSTPTALRGSIAGIEIVAVAGLAAGESAFVNRDALTAYTSATLRLADSDALTLVDYFSLSTFACVADSIPGAIVPIV